MNALSALNFFMIIYLNIFFQVCSYCGIQLMPWIWKAAKCCTSCVNIDEKNLLKEFENVVERLLRNSASFYRFQHSRKMFINLVCLFVRLSDFCVGFYSRKYSQIVMKLMYAIGLYCDMLGIENAIIWHLRFVYKELKRIPLR